MDSFGRIVAGGELEYIWAVTFLEDRKESLRKDGIRQQQLSELQTRVFCDVCKLTQF